MTRFLNLDGSGPRTFRDIFKWSVVETLAGRRRRTPARAPVPRVEPAPELVQHAPRAPGAYRLTWIGHSTFLVQLAGVNLLVDAVLFDSLSGVMRRNVAPGLAPHELPRIDLHLVSHNHYDHLDLPSLRRVRAPILTGRGNDYVFVGAKVDMVQELDWWGELSVGEVRITYVPSHHWSARGIRDRNRGLWGGFIIEAPGVRLYHAGDTAYFSGFAMLRERFGEIDAAMLPIGAYEPRWFMRHAHMGPEDAVRAFVDLGAKRFVPMHWGTFKLTDEPLDEPPMLLQQEWERYGFDRGALSLLAVGQSLEEPAHGHDVVALNGRTG